MEQNIAALTEQVAEVLGQRQWMLASAESCTGGWVAKSATDLAGSSHWFERGFVTYTNDAKMEMLGVSEQTLMLNGAVSEATVSEMARGALRYSRADISLAISGIAGPGGGSAEKPVGTVCFAWAWRKDGEVRVDSRTEHLEGDRAAVRAQAVVIALQGVLERCRDG